MRTLVCALHVPPLLPSMMERASAFAGQDKRVFLEVSTMRRRFLLATLAVAVGLFAGGCTEQQAPMAPGDVNSPESSAPTGRTETTPAIANFSNGPLSPGSSGVFRFQGVLLNITTDPERDLWVVHFQADDWVGCGGGSGPQPTDIQRVNNQEEVFRQISQLQDAPVVVYWLSDPEPDFCKFLAENWLYRGTHSMHSTDNDVAVGGAGANSWGWNAHGTVYDRDGNRYMYNEHQNALINPDGEFLGWKNENIRIVPAGN